MFNKKNYERIEGVEEGYGEKLGKQKGGRGVEERGGNVGNGGSS